MIKIKIICIGNLKEKYFRDAFYEYQKRLNSFCKFELIEIDEYKLKNNPCTSEIKICINSEGNKILSKIPAGSHSIALCIEGHEMTSENLAKYIEDTSINKTGEITFIIGGSYGLSDDVKKRSDFLLSMSHMTFPHQMARIMLCEQIYRAFQIILGGKYHK